MVGARAMILAAAGALALALAVPVRALDIPEPTRKILADLKLDEAILNGLDNELAVPKDWLDGAKREGNVRLTGSWDADEFKALSAPFLARYPQIKVSYTRGSFNARALRPLIAFQEGRYIADIVTGIGGAMPRYIEANALDDLRLLPSSKNVIDGMKSDRGDWIGIRIRYWCMSYNTNKVKASELPKTWEDLLTQPRWRNGHLALANLPQLWVLPLWGMYGEEWADRYLKTLFNEVKPQIRKEGANAVLNLVIAGEFDAAIPSADYRTARYVERGAPVSWHCPTPLPSAISEMAILKGSPNIHAARVFANWLLSKEGQIAQFRADRATPIHKDLQTKTFLMFPDEIAGKTIAFRDPGLEDLHDELLNIWNPLWEKVQ
ncbi:MAG TPA: extracellular solute-binding protein [Alphaproteobacteria bacterium]|jgi:iron(III) transport system substrate-binding protein|nr:extracellular solute-binding protein [Alphaproteobacteria bacterium]